MKLKNFCEIKAIDEARAEEIIKWYEYSGYQIAYAGGFTQCLTSFELIQLLRIFGNSKNLEKSITKHASKLSRPYIEWSEKFRERKKKTRIIEINDCKECPYFETQMDSKRVGNNYKDFYFTTNNSKEKEVEEIKCYCCKVAGEYMRLIKNLGVKYFELEFQLSLKMDKEINGDGDYEEFRKAQDKLYDDYMKSQKIDIPEWCPLKTLQK